MSSFDEMEGDDIFRHSTSASGAETPSTAPSSDHCFSSTYSQPSGIGSDADPLDASRGYGSRKRKSDEIRRDGNATSSSTDRTKATKRLSSTKAASRKEAEPEQPSSRTSSSRSSTHQPVSGRRRRRRTGSEDGEGDDADADAASPAARQTHNLVERNYRIRLNSGFQRLLEALPPSPEVMAGGNGENGEAKVASKAKILELARQRIRAVESENEMLRAQLGLRRVPAENNYVSAPLI